MAFYEQTMSDTPLYFKVPDGFSVRVDGQGWVNNVDATTAFIITLNCDKTSDIALSWRAQADSTVISRNSYINHAWGTAETSGSWPPELVSYTPLIIDFQRKSDKWEVSVNGNRKQDLDYKHRTECVVSSASVTSNVLRSRVGLIDTSTIWHLDGAKFTLSFPLFLVILIMVTAICIVVGRFTKKSLLRKFESGRRYVPANLLKTGAEWWYLANEKTIGPCPNEEMLKKFECGDIHPRTWVKLSWHEDYVPLHELYPMGDEFMQMPVVNEEAQVGQDLRNKLLENELDTMEQKFAEQSKECRATAEDADLGFTTVNMPPGRVEVSQIINGSWAWENSIEPGDRIISLNGCHLNQMWPADYRRLLADRPLCITFEKEGNGYFSIEWYYQVGKKNVGPIDSATMRYYFLRNIVTEKSLVRAGGLGNFISLKTMYPESIGAAFTFPPAFMPAGRVKSAARPRGVVKNMSANVQESISRPIGKVNDDDEDERQNDVKSEKSSRSVRGVKKPVAPTSSDNNSDTSESQPLVKSNDRTAGLGKAATTPQREQAQTEEESLGSAESFAPARSALSSPGPGGRSIVSNRTVTSGVGGLPAGPTASQPEGARSSTDFASNTNNPTDRKSVV